MTDRDRNVIIGVGGMALAFVLTYLLALAGEPRSVRLMCTVLKVC